MKTKLLIMLFAIALLSVVTPGVHGLIPADVDGDGVPDSVDACPAENASYFDRDGDGCIDEVIGARHVEYWGTADTVLSYVINTLGVPSITNGSDMTAIQAAMASWSSIAGTELVVSYSGAVSQENAAALDQVNLVTFVDDEYRFPSAVLAVGITTSFTVDSLYNGRRYRPGEIVDADMIFNPSKTFTTSGGPGSDVQSVATHEAGHFLGLSHSAVRSATTFYVLPSGTAARTLEWDDRLAYQKAYPTSEALTAANRIEGIVTNGATLIAVPGAIVYAIDAVSQDTVGSEYTLPDGSYTFFGLPDGAYFISIYPLNGTSPIGFLKPGYVNDLVASTAVTVFTPEYWDAAESATDDSGDMNSIPVAGGSTARADIITNIDVTSPAVVSVSPVDDETNVRVDAAILIEFTEPIDPSTLSGNFTLLALTGPAAGTRVGGNAAILNDDSVLAFTPGTPLEFASQYELTLGAGLKDRFGNGLSAPFVTSFATEPLPPLAISSLAPNKGVVGSTVVLNGAGFDDEPSNNAVSFNGVPASVSFASASRLVVSVPIGATAGLVSVTVGAETSNQLTFTVLSEVEVARGTEVGVSSLGGTPRSLAVTPDDAYAFVATDVGAAAVVLGAGLPNYLESTPITIPGGLDELDITPDGRRVYAVSRSTGNLHVIDSDPADGPLFTQVLATIPTLSEPLGVVIEPSGRRAYIATPDSAIQVWDINLQSATYQRQIGEISILDPNLRGKMAVTPNGGRLLALSGTGDLYVFDLSADSMLAQIEVGTDPHDVTVDPLGQRAYVSDRTGSVTVVSLASFNSVQDIETGGSLRGLALTPAGLWLYAADQQLNLIDVIDLDEEKPTFRSVAATMESSRDPVDVEVSPDGIYAYSIVRDEGQLVATAIGSGPIIKTLSRRSGPVGAAVVIAGSGFGGGEVVRVDFNGLTVGPRNLTGTAVVCNVPSGATSGPVRVEWWEGGDAPRQFSNAVFFEVLGPTPPGGGMRLGAIAAPATPISEAMAISPLGDLAVVGHESGAVSFLDLDPSSPTYNQFIGTVKPLDYEVTDIAITPDGTKAIVISSGTNLIPVINVNRSSKTFGKAVGQVTDSLGFQEPGIVRIDPSGEFGLVYDRGTDTIYFIDLVEGSSTQYESFRSVPKPAVTDIQISPTGKFASVLESAVPGYWSLITDPFHPSYGLLTGNMPFDGTPPPIPVWASFYPSGDTVLVYAVQQVGPSERLVLAFDVSTPENPHSVSSGAPELPSNSRYAGEQLRISPRGDRYILNVTDSGFHYYGREETPWENLGSEFTFANRSRLRWDFVPDASRFYVASDFRDSVLVYDFSTAQIISSLSGNEQIGVVNELLPAPLRVQVSTQTGLSSSGVAVRFRSITPGGGNFAIGDRLLQEVVVATDDDGVASVDFVLGPALGSQFVEVTAQGLAGSPLTFIANAEENPSTLPLRVAQVLPFGGATNVSVTTALQVTFSRAVDALSIGGSSLYVHEQGNATPLAVVYGFADGDRRVSLTPVSPLAYGTSYVIETTAGIRDSDGGPLLNPASSTFSTQAPPPPTIASIAPPAGTAGITVVISGAGFDPVASGNTVLFNSVAATPTTGGVDHLNVIVPNTAASGLLRVVVGADTSNAVSFNVLVPSTSSVDDVIATANTGSGTKSITVTPDGALAYAVSPESDIVIPIGVDSLKTYPAIPVGDEPVAIAMHPEGTFAYVPNFGSASVSIIGTDPDAVGFNTVVQTLIVGASPVDVAVLPDGRRVLVANSGSNNLSVLDADSSSATHHTVVATVQTGSSTRTVTVSPDGTRVFVGTDTDILVLEALGYSVVATVQTGSSTKQITVSPDGTLLFVLTSADELLIVDVEPASPTENSVVATVQTGSGAKSVTVSPDGGLLYLVQEDSDEVIVVSVETLGSAGVIEERATLPPKSVAVAFVDTIPTGDDPQSLAFDPTGSGRFIVTTAGDRSISLFGRESPVIPADITLFPQILVVLSEDDLQWWQFRYIRAWIELPTGYDPRHIEVPSIRVNDVVTPVPGYSKITDIDGDGIDELHVKFDRLDFQRALPIGWVVPVRVAGSVDGQQFLGETRIVTIRPLITHPKGGDFVPPGQIVRIKWQSPLGYAADAVDVRWSPDDGRTWQLIAGGKQDVGYCDWRTPEIHCDSARVLVTLFKNGQEIGTGMSDETFSISAPLAVKLASFGGTIEDGDAVLTWRTNSEAGTTGFHVLRAEAVEGSYQRITSTEVPAVGGSQGASYQYRDPSIQPNRRYFFKLQEVTVDGAGGESEAFELVSSLSFDLEQNAPNPFNPSTVIRFSVAEDVHVRLIVYDVAGRTVRTLVDEVRRPDLYKLVWDGTNDAGQTVASGVYFYRVTAGKFVKSRKMLLLK